MDVALSLLGLLGMVALTAGTFVFVAGEFALTALERSTIDAHVQQIGDRRARQVKRAHSTLSFQLSGAQVGITITTLVTGYIAEPAIAGLLNAFSTAFRWLISGLNSSANWIVWRLGIEPAEDLRSARSPQELGSLVRSSAQQGTLDQGTATLLDRSLRFGERTAEELMTPRMRVQALRTDATALALVDAARRTGFSRFPVYGSDLDDVRGVVHVKQAFAVPADLRVATLAGALANPVPTVPNSLDGDALLDRLRGQGLQVAIVVDEYGGTAGIVTLEDLVEEIVGDVRDEHDRMEVSQVQPLGDERWIISGLLRVDEVADAVGLAMPRGDYETVAGLVLERLGRIPDVGDEIDLDGWQLTVIQMDRRRIADLRLTQIARAQQVAQ